MGAAEGVGADEDYHLLLREPFVLEIFGLLCGVEERGGEVRADFFRMGNDAVTTAGRDRVKRYAGDYGGVASSEGDDVSAGHSFRANVL
ncbi:hypothetical protein IEQ34_026298 [Dendrobium chrysotoxum]|uniref:Uncharacterized protein n=1 Tax=Dendrobium chrysotoxum TaxID=161865 RepID=A0AAV7FIP4_DENCH|nr:hypothetical protein IEQ34_026298 [Dendrobium chrysotoxum]